MNDNSNAANHVGLCLKCRHVQVVTAAKGSTFYLCRLAATDTRFRKYPALPVHECVGFSPRENDDEN